MRLNFITMATGSADYEKLANIFSVSTIVLFVLAGVCLAFAIFAFITFKIPNVIGDLTGRNARKSIAQMRQENEKDGKKSHHSHPVAAERGTLTESIKQSNDKLKKQKQTTQKNKPVTKPDFIGGSATDVLCASNTTERLDYNETGTEILAEGTQVLSKEQMQAVLNQTAIGFKMIQNIIFVHTDEVI